jgi:N-acetylmuramoyl-L-alanine amidase
MIVCVDPGHGGRFSGAKANGLIEAQVNLDVAKHLKHELMHRGIFVVLTRVNDLELDPNLNRDLAKRREMAREFDADCFVSIHCNAFSNPAARGMEVFTGRGEDGSDELATWVYRSFREQFPDLKWRSDYSDGDVDKEANFAVLRSSYHIPSVLVELGFLTNEHDARQLADPAFRKQCAVALANALEDWRDASGRY